VTVYFERPSVRDLLVSLGQTGQHPNDPREITNRGNLVGPEERAELLKKIDAALARLEAEGAGLPPDDSASAA
jgi:hypothetical protein